MPKQRKKKLDDELVTRGMLKGVLSRGFKQHRLEWKSELQKEIHGLEYRINSNMDALLEVKLEQKLEQKITPLIREMREYRETFQILADKVIGVHKNFEVESASIRQNYNQLEGRVKQVEEIVLPYQGQA